MDFFKTHGKAVGIVLDLSLRHNHNGERIVDVVKRKLVDFVRLNFDDGQDAMYLYHPEITVPSYKIGEHVSAIGNYDTDGGRFREDYALKQTLFVIAAEDQDFDKYIFFITDRINNYHPLKKLVYLNHKDGVNANITMIGIGDYYDKGVCKMIQAISKDNLVEYIHLDADFDLSYTLFKETDYGIKDICGQTDECCE